MPIEEDMCITKKAVEDVIYLMDYTINLLHEKGSKQILSEKEYDLLADAKSEKAIYEKVKVMLDNREHNTVCMTTSNIKRKGKIKIFTERDEDEDINLR